MNKQLIYAIGVTCAAITLAGCTPSWDYSNGVPLSPTVEYKTPEEIDAHRSESDENLILAENTPDGGKLIIEDSNLLIEEKNQAISLDYNTSFEIGLYNQYAKKYAGTNFTFSPYSLLDAFSILYPVTSGSSREEMDSVLSFEDKSEYFYRQYDGDGSSNLDIANIVYYRPDLEDYINLDNFDGANIAPYETLDKVNEFVSNATHGKIENFINDEGLIKDNVITIINALYFRKNFLETYEKDTILFNGSETESFSGTLKPANLKEMTPEIDLIRLPYSTSGPGENQYALYIFANADEDKDAVKEYIDSVSDEDLHKALDFREYGGTGKYSTIKFNVKAFEARTKNEEVTDSLKVMGLTSPFKEDCLDFNENLFYSGTPVSDTPTYISAVIQEACVETDYKGTEASASTEVALSLTSSASIVTEEAIKYVNTHNPFVFVIKDDTNDTIMFMGRIEE